MLVLPSSALDHLTGAELVERVRKARRSNGKIPDDLEVDGHRYKVYTVRVRGRPPTVHMWREIQVPLVVGGVDTGEVVTDVVHLQGLETQRIEEMRGH